MSPQSDDLGASLDRVAVAALDWKARAEAAEAVLGDIVRSGVEYETRGYKTIQIDRDVWAAASRIVAIQALKDQP